MTPEWKVVVRVALALAFIALWHAAGFWRALADFGGLLLIAIVAEVLSKRGT